MKNGIGNKLYLCATPIGNLGDITLRAVETLKGVDKIYCEDTRNTLKLLNALDIKKPLESCHEHNEKLRADRIAAEVRGGMSVAFVSDAGMPGVSDPGAALIEKFIAEGLPYCVLPGASAAITAFVMSGLDTDEMYFVGFLPRSGRERAQKLNRVIRSTATTVIYESPLRVGATLSDIENAILAAGGDPSSRRCALAREITKAFEECVRGSVSCLRARYETEAPRGECVILLGGAEKSADDPQSGEKLASLLTLMLDEGVTVKSAAKIAAEALGVPKNAAYKLADELRNGRSE
ncbi:MAG: 16S rRNA (cytidine(1402)-2'-O)-methyltransferase [Clostridia bacterium]|nr:16S rRNA (cytidine(1402)-2'-O)-methyltransferase [Clostridia bacterium]